MIIPSVLKDVTCVVLLSRCWMICRIEKITINEKFYKLWISSIHAKIGFFVWFPHVTINLEYNTWSSITSELKQLQEERKKMYFNASFEISLASMKTASRKDLGHSMMANQREFFYKFQIIFSVYRIRWLDYIKVSNKSPS